MPKKTIWRNIYVSMRLCKALHSSHSNTFHCVLPIYNHFLLNAFMQKNRFKSVSISFNQWEKIYLKRKSFPSQCVYKKICQNLIQIQLNVFLPKRKIFVRYIYVLTRLRHYMQNLIRICFNASWPYICFNAFTPICKNLIQISLNALLPMRKILF